MNARMREMKKIVYEARRKYELKQIVKKLPLWLRLIEKEEEAE